MLLFEIHEDLRQAIFVHPTFELGNHDNSGHEDLFEGMIKFLVPYGVRNSFYKAYLNVIALSPNALISSGV